MRYRKNSLWNEESELKCLLIFKMLEISDFPRGKQMEYCIAIEKDTGLDRSNLSAKVSNYKSVAKVNNSSNASKNTIRIYEKYSKLSIEELEKIIDKNNMTIYR